MAAEIIARTRFEIGYWALAYPGFMLCKQGRSGRFYWAGIVWLRSIRRSFEFVAGVPLIPS